MNKILGILSVILFWMLTITLLPVIVFGGAAIILFYLIYATSEVVYQVSVRYLERKLK